MRHSTVPVYWLENVTSTAWLSIAVVMPTASPPCVAHHTSLIGMPGNRSFPVASMVTCDCADTVALSTMRVLGDGVSDSWYTLPEMSERHDTTTGAAPGE